MWAFHKKKPGDGISGLHGAQKRFTKEKKKSEKQEKQLSSKKSP